MRPYLMKLQQNFIFSLHLLGGTFINSVVGGTPAIPHQGGAFIYQGIGFDAQLRSVGTFSLGSGNTTKLWRVSLQLGSLCCMLRYWVGGLRDFWHFSRRLGDVRASRPAMVGPKQIEAHETCRSANILNDGGAMEDK